MEYRQPLDHSGLMPANLTTLPHFAVSTIRKEGGVGALSPAAGFVPTASIAVPSPVLRRIARETTVRTSHLGPIPVLTKFFAMLLREYPIS
jgi:hypothetical protein